MKRNEHAALLVAAALCVLSVVALRFLPEPAHTLEQLVLTNASGMPIRVLLYLPESVPVERVPGVVICQPFNNPHEFGRNLALELVNRGFIAIVFDWRGHSPEENRQTIAADLLEIGRQDVAAAIQYLRDREDVDPDKIMIAGHSVGATLAIESAMQDFSVAAVAAIGMEADVSTSLPRNLLWAVGLYDEFRPLASMRKTLAASAGIESAREGETYGSFPNGTARRLHVSATADHFMELQDASIHQAVLRWFMEAAEKETIGGPANLQARTLFYATAWLAFAAGVLVVLRRLARWTRNIRR